MRCGERLICIFIVESAELLLLTIGWENTVVRLGWKAAGRQWQMGSVRRNKRFAEQWGEMKEMWRPSSEPESQANVWLLRDHTCVFLKGLAQSCGLLRPFLTHARTIIYVFFPTVADNRWFLFISLQYKMYLNFWGTAAWFAKLYKVT